MSGTFAQAAERLPAVRDMGFDIVYLPPIHPVGSTARKGRNNTLTPAPDDPGVPWAIGSEAGGHDAIHPDLGTLEDFEDFVSTARSLGLEVALDLALQCSPDHPWVREHPEWFTTRADGSIAYAENPPKKYQDIYPLNFDNDPEGLYREVLRVVNLWIDRGVTVFRVDNPHTKPVQFWEWLFAQVAPTEHPEVIFLAEAFTRPAMMHTLGKVGLHAVVHVLHLAEHARRRCGSTSPSCPARPRATCGRTSGQHPRHPARVPPVRRPGRRSSSGRCWRATLSPSWGVYSGYELCEHVAVRAGSEEYLDSEKYQYRPRDWERDGRRARSRPT